MPQPVRVTDRSRIECFNNCPRKRYWAYEWNGRGLVPEGPTPTDLAYGLAFHEGAECLVYGGSLDEALAKGKLHTDQIEGVTVDRHPKKDEYYALLYGHLRTLSEYFLPAFLERYSILAAETEIILPLSPSLLGLFRLDLGVRDKETGVAYNVEWKTDKNPSDIYERMEYYLQLLLETKALSVHLGEPVKGTIIVGIEKGAVRGPLEDDKKAGRDFGERRMSPFTYAFHRNAGIVDEYGYKYKPKWDRVPIWVQPLVMETWWSMLLSYDFDPLSQIVVTPPVAFSEDRLEKVQEQIVEMEKRLAWDIRGKGLEGVYQNFQNCKNDGGYKRHCPFIPLCHQGMDDDPLGNGFKYREPNHPLEVTIQENEG